MSGVSAAIQINDYMSPILNHITNSMNMMLNTFNAVQSATERTVDLAAYEGIRQSINAAETALLNFQRTLSTPPQPPQPPPQPPQPPPPTWINQNMQVFTNTGVERFESELQSANTMMQQLTQTQNSITRHAMNMRATPPNMINDIITIDNRMSQLSTRVQQLNNIPVNMRTSATNNELERLRGLIGQATQAQNVLNTAMRNADISTANNAYRQLNSIIDLTERNIRDNLSGQEQFNQSINRGIGNSNNLFSSIKRMAGMYIGLRGVGSIIKLSDTVSQTTARLNMMKGEQENVGELQEAIFQSAQRSRTSYQGTADVVSKLGLRAKAAFGSSNETIAFAENLNKSFVIAGASQQEVASASLQLTQALGSGVLRGEELNAVFEAAPNVIQTVADYIGKDIGQIRELASGGQITADIVKNAMLSATDKINEQFDSMPKTFSQVFTGIKNEALWAFQPVLQQLSDIANSQGFNDFVSGIINGLAFLASVVTEVFNIVTQVGGFISDNWSIIEPIIYGVVAALTAYAAYLAIVNGVELISKGIKMASCLVAYAHAAATGTEVAANAALTASQWGLNTALLACPLTWIIIAIIAVIAIVYAVVAAFNKFTGSAVSGTGVICGAIFFAGAVIGNIFLALINFVIDIFVVLWNFIVIFVNFFANVFNDPIGSIARLFFDLVDMVLSLLQTLASAIDTLFGSSLAGAVQGWRDDLGGWVDDTFGVGDVVMEKVNAQDYHFDRMVYGDAYDKGNDFGKGLDAKMNNLFKNPATDLPTSAFDASNVPANVGNIAGDTKDMKNSMDITQDELKYLRDIAEQDVINRFTTAEIKVQMTNNNNIKSSMDLTDIGRQLANITSEVLQSAAEGVYT